MQHFIPERDELLFAEIPVGKLVPYRVGLPCLHWEAAIVDAGDEDRILKVLTSEDEKAAAESQSRTQTKHQPFAA